ncbi:MAG: hypothetical protein A2V90_01740 [Gammaproteobacteria bacterium RBG_16_57_12]|nr:MAG: hypothetical protein A2V90_01740 [Gammaproteobacteria bacterium RBG_16_57_12]
MKIKAYRLTALSAAVLSALSTQAVATVDGFDYSGSDARSSALQSDYSNLRDSYNIWVNPAQVVNYSNRVDINIPVSSSQEAAGVYKTLGNGQTFGVYIGRPSSSNLAADLDDSLADPTNYGFSGNQSISPTELTSATGGTPFNAQTGTQNWDISNAPQVEQPKSQFDLFWGTTAGGNHIGARLNFQALTDEDSLPAPSWTDPNAINTATFAGILNTSAITANHTKMESDELNLALGIEMPALNNLEVSLTFGMPDASSSSTFADNVLRQNYNGAGLINYVDNTTFTGSQTIESDSAQNLGLALRVEPMPDTLVTLGYQNEENNSTNSLSAVETYTEDTTNDGTLDVNVVDRFASSGTRTDEQTTLQLQVTRNYNPTPTSLLSASVGWADYEYDQAAINTTTAHSFTDNIAGTTTYNDGCEVAPRWPCLGTQTNSAYSYEQTRIPLIIAMEGELNANWKLRGSVTKNLYEAYEENSRTTYWDMSDTDTTAGTSTAGTQIATYSTNQTNERVWSGTSTAVALGAGYTRGPVTVDAVVEKEFAMSGTDNGLLSRVSVTWMLP